MVRRSWSNWYVARARRRMPCWPLRAFVRLRQLAAAHVASLLSRRIVRCPRPRRVGCLSQSARSSVPTTTIACCGATAPSPLLCWGLPPLSSRRRARRASLEVWATRPRPMTTSSPTSCTCGLVRIICSRTSSPHSTMSATRREALRRRGGKEREGNTKLVDLVQLCTSLVYCVCVCVCVYSLCVCVYLYVCVCVLVVWAGLLCLNLGDAFSLCASH